MVKIRRLDVALQESTLCVLLRAADAIPSTVRQQQKVWNFTERVPKLTTGPEYGESHTGTFDNNYIHQASLTVKRYAL